MKGRALRFAGALAVLAGAGSASAETLFDAIVRNLLLFALRKHGARGGHASEA